MAKAALLAAWCRECDHCNMRQQVKSRLAGVQNKHRVDLNLIKPAVDWRKSGAASATMTAAIAR